MQVGLVANQALSSFKTYIYVCKTCIHATPQAPVSAQHELHIILRRPLRTDADTDADPRGEVFGPRYDSNMLTLVGVYQIIWDYHPTNIWIIIWDYMGLKHIENTKDVKPPKPIVRAVAKLCSPCTNRHYL